MTAKNLESRYGSLHGTPMSRTGGGGSHIIFSKPDFPIQKNALEKGIDILSDGAYFIAPPSRHASGNPYSWLRWKKPAKLPPAYEALLVSPPNTGRSERATRTVAGNGVGAGQRNNTLTRYVGKMHRDGMNEAAMRMRAALIETNNTCHPPLEHTEVERIVASVIRHPRNSESNGEDPYLTLMEQVLATEYANGAHLISVQKTFWRYNGRFWQQISDEIVQKGVLKAIRRTGLSKGYGSATAMRAVTLLLGTQVARDDDPLRFSRDPLPVVNCLNGEVWIDRHGAVQLRPHTPRSFLRDCLNVKYDPAATCPRYDKALLEIFAISTNPQQMATFWNRLLGYIIQPGCTVKILLRIGAVPGVVASGFRR